MTGLLVAKNRRALFDHQLIDKYTAGIVLKGYEVKAIRENKVSFEGSYIHVVGGSPVLLNLYIGQYSKMGKGYTEQDSKRTRHLLLNAYEIEQLRRMLHEKGRTAVPLALVLVNGRMKLEFAVVKGKKEFEKKQTAKERQIQKDLQVEFKETQRIKLP